MKKKILLVLVLLFSIAFVGCNDNKNDDPQIDSAITSIETTESLIEMEVGEHKVMPINYDGLGDYTDLNVTTDVNDLVTIEEGLITGKKSGIVNVTVSAKNNTEIKTSFTIYVNSQGYRKTTLTFDIPTNGLVIGRSFDLGINNLDFLKAKGNEDFTFTVSDPNIIEITDDYKVKGLKNGTASITARQKANPSNVGVIDIYVGNQSTKITKGEPDDTPLILYFEDGDYTIDCDKDEQIIIEGAKNYQRYYYNFTEEKNLLISDTGKFMGVSEGKVKVTVLSKDASNKMVKNTITVTVTGTRYRDDYLDRLMAMAESQIGVKEETGNNDVRYNEWKHSTEAWCANFISWCANEVGIPNDILPKTYSVLVYRNLFEIEGRFFLKEDYHPVRGDLIIFLSNGASHVGLVTGADNEKVYTIEGNTSDMVSPDLYPLDYKTITGYCHPDYDAGKRPTK